jgi:hypothetical protein
MSKLLIPRSVLLIGCLIGCAVLLILLPALIPMHRTHSMTAEPRVIIEKKIGNIQYGAYFDPVQQQVVAEVTYDYFTPEGVQEYIAFNRRLSQTLAQRDSGLLRIIVHFSRPLSQTEFEAFVKKYGVQVHSYFMRAVEADGRRAGIVGAPEGEQLVPQHLLKTVLNDLKERNSAEFKGWISVDVTTNPANLDLMQYDPDVILIEASHTLIYDALTPQALQQVGAFAETIRKIQTNPDEVVQITGPGLNLEDAGLVSIPIHSGQITVP